MNWKSEEAGRIQRNRYIANYVMMKYDIATFITLMMVGNNRYFDWWKVMVNRSELTYHNKTLTML